MLRRSLLPAVPNLLAFEAAARHGSISRAAEELSLTQSAISRQVIQLEVHLGTPLFQRIRKRIILTEAGRQYASQIRPILQGLSEATHNAKAFVGAGGFLNLAVMPTFATRWLVPRLPTFMEKHPGVTVNFATRIEPFDFAHEPYDAAIHFGALPWAGAIREHLMDEEVVPVCSPAYLRQHRIRTPRDLANARLLQQTTRPTLWADWFQQVAVDAPEALKGHRFEQFAMIEQAAVAGLGVALLPRFVVEHDVASARLRIILPDRIMSTEAYSIVYPASKAQGLLLQSFRTWLLDQARRGSVASRRRGQGMRGPLPRHSVSE